MAWIESHQELRNHPKLSATRQKLDAAIRSKPSPQAQLIGHLHLLWWWCMDYAMDGDISAYSEVQIADAAGWLGDPAEFIRALTDAGWLDGRRGGVRGRSLQVHDWLDFCGELVLKRLRRKESKKQKSAAVRQTFSAESAPTVPNRTVPNQERESPSAAKAAPPIAIPYREFLEAWNANAGSLPAVSALSDKRRQKVRQRWLENPRLDYWIAVVRRMAKSTFCQGKSDRGWRADFDFLIANDTNHLKVMEGKYDNTEVGRGAYDSKSSSGLAADAERVREIRRSSGLRKVSGFTAGAVLAGIRDHAVGAEAVPQAEDREPVGE